MALRLAKQAAKIPPDAPIKLTLFPREKQPIELIYDRLTGKDGDEGGATSGSIERSLKAVAPLVQHLDALLDNPGVLMMPPIGPVR